MARDTQRAELAGEEQPITFGQAFSSFMQKAPHYFTHTNKNMKFSTYLTGALRALSSGLSNIKNRASWGVLYVLKIWDMLQYTFIFASLLFYSPIIKSSQSLILSPLIRFKWTNHVLLSTKALTFLTFESHYDLHLCVIFK